MTVLNSFEALPGGLYRLRALTGRVDRLRSRLQVGNVSRAVRKNGLGCHTDDGLRARERAKQRIVKRELCAPVHPEALRCLVHRDEQNADPWVRLDVAETPEHAVTVIVRKDQVIGREDLHKTPGSRLERTVGSAIRARGRKKKEPRTLDESFVCVREMLASGFLSEAVC